MRPRETPHGQGRRPDDEVTTHLQKDALPDVPLPPTVVVPTIMPTAR